MNSYAQKQSTGIHRLGNTPNAARNTWLYLTSWVRFDRWAQAPWASCQRPASRLLGALCLLLSLMTLQMQHASAVGTQTQVDHLKLYAHSRIINWKQFQCFNKIITQESRWNYKAKNGSHFGLGQMRNTNYKKLDAYTQIDWSIRYMTHRYQTPCKALAFMHAHGYH